MLILVPTLQVRNIQYPGIQAVGYKYWMLCHACEGRLRVFVHLFKDPDTLLTTEAFNIGAHSQTLRTFTPTKYKDHFNCQRTDLQYGDAHHIICGFGISIDYSQYRPTSTMATELSSCESLLTWSYSNLLSPGKRFFSIGYLQHKEC